MKRIEEPITGDKRFEKRDGKLIEWNMRSGIVYDESEIDQEIANLDSEKQKKQQYLQERKDKFGDKINNKSK